MLKPPTPGTPSSNQNGEAELSDEEGYPNEDHSDIELVITPLPQLDRKVCHYITFCCFVMVSNICFHSNQDPSLNKARYLKTVVTATIDHIAKYLGIRYDFEGLKSELNGHVNGGGDSSDVLDHTNSSDIVKNNCDTSTANANSTNATSSSTSSVTGAVNGTSANPAVLTNGHAKSSTYPFTIYIAAGPGQYNPIPGNMSLQQVLERYWTSERERKPLELFYAYKVKPTTPVDNSGMNKNGSTQKTW